MNIAQKIKDNAQNLLFLSALSLCQVYYVLKAVFSLDSSFVLSCFAVLVLIASALILSSLPKKVYLLIYAALAVTITIIVIKSLEPISAFFEIAFLSLSNTINIPTDSPLLISFALALTILFINYIIIMVMKKSQIAAIVSVGLICLIYFTYDYIPILFLIFYLAVILIIFMRWFSPQMYKNSDSKNQFLVPFVLVLTAAVLIAPMSVGMSKARPEPLKWIDEIDWFEEESPSVQKEYVIRIDGQSKLTNLDNSFTYSDTRMMIVTSPYLERLRNKTYDIYNRTGWEKLQEDNLPNKNTQYSMDDMIILLDENSIPYIKYQMDVELIAQSQMVFSPLNSKLLTEFQTELFKNPYDDLYLSEPMPEETSYSLETLKIDFKSPEFIEYITKSKSDNIDNMEGYLDIPESLYEAIKPLALGLTKDAESNYEKAKTIESYLSSQFTYNLEPLDKPSSEDFVEYFLFETKEGFCTHYATSMVMLLRSIDIPCRYVTGYLLNTPTEFSYQSGVLPDEVLFTEGLPYDFSIVKRDSHAWVEVWFDDFGWLTFEPTSGYPSPLGLGIEVEYMDFENIQLIEEEPIEEESNNIILLILAVIVSAAVIAAVVIRIISSANKIDEEKINMLWNRIKKSYYKKRKIEKKNETAQEFCMRADIDNENLKAAAKIYEFALFSKKDILPWQVVKMSRLTKSLRQSNRKYRKEIQRK